MRSVGKNYALDRKIDGTFFDGHDELYQHATFGKDRTLRAGCRCEMWCLFLSRSDSGAPCVRGPGVHSSNRHCDALYCPISTRFSAFFHKGLLFQMHYLVRIFVASWRHNFREIAVKNCEKAKNRRKSLCAPFRF